MEPLILSMLGFFVFGVESPQGGKPLGQADLNKTRKDRIMDSILMGLICGGLVLIVPIFALIKASGAAKDVDDLKQKVQRLQGRLNEMSDQFADAE
ncbi:MAG: hypothetical protein NZ605_02915, partial [Acidimicrobiales bacterium]|nr:hypothetical protein [Acidimicrobiales bacterium]